MATITHRNLTINHNHTAKSAKVMVTCKANFTAFEMAQMKQGLQFKLVCQLWGDDSGLTGADDFLYTIPSAKFFPDGTPSASENIAFEATVGEGLLNEDLGTDEIYARLKLSNLYTQVTIAGNTNIVSHNF